MSYKNLTELDLKVYPVDLLQLYLERKGLDDVENVDLAGIAPAFEKRVDLAKGSEFEPKTIEVPITVKNAGAYLVMARSGDLFSSGVLLVSPLSLEVVEDQSNGRARATLRDARSKSPVSRVEVKAVGTDDQAIQTGSTDPRGVFMADRIQGKLTIIARRGPNEYALYRGKTSLGESAKSSVADKGLDGSRNPVPMGQRSALEDSLKNLNNENQTRQIEKLRDRYKSGMSGGMGGGMGGMGGGMMGGMM